MAELNFFQSIFCKGSVNIYKSESDENALDDFDGTLNLEDKSNNIPNISNESLVVNSFFESDLGGDISFELDSSASNQVYKTDFVSDTISNNVDLHKEPVVSGFIFDDVDENDANGFNINLNVVDDKTIDEIDDNALNLIEKLKSDGIEKEREKEALKSKNQEIYEKVTKVESEIDLPLL